MERIANTIQGAVDRIMNGDSNMTSNTDTTSRHGGYSDDTGYHHSTSASSASSRDIDPRQASAVDMSSGTRSTSDGDPTRHRHTYNQDFLGEDRDEHHHRHSGNAPTFASDVNADNIMKTAKDLAVGTFKEGYGWITGDTAMHDEGRELRRRASGASSHRRI
ncbi:hypothetical protein BDF22DRAFT_746720 [Syncephalis plumigaleata]|nr:hypothetical protein BDF22DRAFT_746720 [Syncephalis plumigaleata]